MASKFHHTGEGGPGYWLPSPPCQPILQDGAVDTLGISTMFVLQGSDSGSTEVLKEENAKVGVAGAELSGDVDGFICGWEADEERKSGRVLCAGKEVVEVTHPIGIYIIKTISACYKVLT